MRFDLVDLSLFVASADAGSLTHGAERCGLGLAAASARMRLLEDRMNVKLFERSRRGVVATVAGQSILRHARTVLEHAAALQADAAEFAGGMKGRVRLLSNTNALAEFLPTALGGFLAAHPEISVEVEEHLSHEIVRAVAAGEAEMGIVAGTTDAAELATYPFARDELVLVVADRSRIGPTPASFATVLGEDFIGLQDTSAIQSFIATHAAQAGRPIRLRMRLLGFEGVCRMVETGAGVAVVPRSAATRAAATMNIRIVQLTDAWAERDLRLCVVKQATLAPVASLLLQHLRSDRGD